MRRTLPFASRVPVAALLLAIAACGGSGGSVLDDAPPEDPLPTGPELEALAAESVAPSFSLVIPTQGVSATETNLGLHFGSGYWLTAQGLRGQLSGELQQVRTVSAGDSQGNKIIIGLGSDGMPLCAWDTIGNRFYFSEWSNTGLVRASLIARWRDGSAPVTTHGGPVAADLAALRTLLGLTAPDEATAPGSADPLPMVGAALTSGMQTLAVAQLVGRPLRQAYAVHAMAAPPDAQGSLLALSNLSALLSSFDRTFDGFVSPSDVATYFRADDYGHHCLQAIEQHAGVLCERTPAGCASQLHASLIGPGDSLPIRLRELYPEDTRLPKAFSYFSLWQQHDACIAVVSNCHYTLLSKEIVPTADRLDTYLKTGLPYAFTDSFSHSGSFGKGAGNAGGAHAHVELECRTDEYNGEPRHCCCGLAITGTYGVRFVVHDSVRERARLVGTSGPGHVEDGGYVIHNTPFGETVFDRPFMDYGPSGWGALPYSEIRPIAVSLNATRGCQPENGPSVAGCATDLQVVFEGATPPVIDWFDVSYVSQRTRETECVLGTPEWHTVDASVTWSAHDPDDGTAPMAGIVWGLVLLEAEDGTLSHSLRYPEPVVPGQNIHMKIRLIVMDDEGTTVTATKDLDICVPPQKPWWYDLPACPRRAEQAQAGAWCDDIGLVGWVTRNLYHPGADVCFRQAGVAGSPGQQCCYSTSGDLITDQSGAGTPDKVSVVSGKNDSGGCNINHDFYTRHDKSDVRPWHRMSYGEYFVCWPPSGSDVERILRERYQEQRRACGRAP